MRVVIPGTRRTGVVLFAAVAALFFSSCATGEATAKTSASGKVQSRFAKERIRAGDIEPVDMGVVSVGINDFFFTKVNEKSAAVSWAPSVECVVMKINLQGNTTFLYFESAAREFLRSVAAAYKQDFEDKRLDVEAKKTDRAYGSFIFPVTWGLMTQNAEGRPAVKLGYVFKDGAPYFALSFPVTKNDLAESGSKVQSASAFTLYFTRAQLQDFIEKMDEEAFAALNAELGVGRAGLASPDVY